MYGKYLLHINLHDDLHWTLRYKTHYWFYLVLRLDFKIVQDGR
jgi:hypothetical protein